MISALFPCKKRKMLLDPASHSIAFNWNLTFLGFISDIADLLLIVDTPL